MTRLSLKLTDGTPVQFTSCHQCDHRTWESEGKRAGKLRFGDSINDYFDVIGKV